MDGWTGTCDCGRPGTIRQMPNAPVSLMICDRCYGRWVRRRLGCRLLVLGSFAAAVWAGLRWGGVL